MRAPDFSPAADAPFNSSQRALVWRPALVAVLASACGVLAACGGGDGDGDATGGGGGGGGGGFTATCNTAAYVAGAVELPDSTTLATYAGSYAGDEGSYNDSGSFVKSGSATLVVATDGQLTYKGTAYTPSSVCIDKVAGPYGKLVYVLVGTNGHFDIADRVDATLGQAWGVSPVDGTTIFTNGRK